MYVAKLTVTDDGGLVASVPVIAKVVDTITPRIESFFVPSQVKLMLGPGDAYTQNLAVVAQLYGHYNGNIRNCGVVYVERDDRPYRGESLCFPSSGKVTISFPVTFSAQDAPEVHWTAYLILDTGEKSEFAKASTRVATAE